MSALVCFSLPASLHPGALCIVRCHPGPSPRRFELVVFIYVLQFSVPHGLPFPFMTVDDLSTSYNLSS